MGLTTGNNISLAAWLLLEQCRRFGFKRQPYPAWVEAGFCIDAPCLMAAGSHFKDVIGDDDSEQMVLSMPTTVGREQ